MTNTELLLATIQSRGLRHDYIAEKLHISRQAYYNKLSNKSEFRQSEIATLAQVLSLTTTELEQIFFNAV